MSNFWDTVLLMVSTFFFIAYLIVLFQVVVDLFRDSEMEKNVETMRRTVSQKLLMRLLR